MSTVEMVREICHFDKPVKWTEENIETPVHGVVYSAVAEDADDGFPAFRSLTIHAWLDKAGVVTGLDYDVDLKHCPVWLCQKLLRECRAALYESR